MCGPCPIKLLVHQRMPQEGALAVPVERLAFACGDDHQLRPLISLAFSEKQVSNHEAVTLHCFRPPSGAGQSHSSGHSPCDTLTDPACATFKQGQFMLCLRATARLACETFDKGLPIIRPAIRCHQACESCHWKTSPSVTQRHACQGHSMPCLRTNVPCRCLACETFPEGHPITSPRFPCHQAHETSPSPSGLHHACQGQPMLCLRPTHRLAYETFHEGHSITSPESHCHQACESLG